MATPDKESGKAPKTLASKPNSKGNSRVSSPRKISRVFVNDKDAVGLHISRSIGDTKAHKAGVISDPEIKHFIL